MVKLDKGAYRTAYDIYLDQQYFYPLIGAVLLDDQDGTVFVNDRYRITQVYVEHAFGFSQIFGGSSLEFENELENYLLTEKNFLAGKVRLYCPALPAFADSLNEKSSLAFRRRYILDKDKYSKIYKNLSAAKNPAITSCNADDSTIESIEQKFSLVKRFWRTEEDYIEKSKAVAIRYNGEIASICYAAAVSNRAAEIDVLTLEEFRKLGLAKFAVMEFIRGCLNDSIDPLWDCFTNNQGSVALAESTGFSPKGPEYRFFTINKVNQV